MAYVLSPLNLYIVLNQTRIACSQQSHYGEWHITMAYPSAIQNAKTEIKTRIDQKRKIPLATSSQQKICRTLYLSGNKKYKLKDYLIFSALYSLQKEEKTNVFKNTEKGFKEKKDDECDLIAVHHIGIDVPRQQRG